MATTDDLLEKNKDATLELVEKLKNKEISLEDIPSGLAYFCVHKYYWKQNNMPVVREMARIAKKRLEVKTKT